MYFERGKPGAVSITFFQFPQFQDCVNSQAPGRQASFLLVRASLADAKVSEDDVKELLRVHPTTDAAELAGGGPQLLARQVERRLRPQARQLLEGIERVHRRAHWLS